MKNNAEEIRPNPKADGKPGDPFYYANLVQRYSMRIAAHSHSPLFADDTREDAALLFKTQAIDQEQLIRMLSPPNKDALIHALRERQARAALQRALQPQQPHPIARRGKAA
jgi:hypothetical protein